MAKNNWTVLDDAEVKAAVDKFKAIKAEAETIEEPARMKFVHGKLSELTQNELYAITATVMSEKL